MYSNQQIISSWNILISDDIFYLTECEWTEMWDGRVALNALKILKESTKHVAEMKIVIFLEILFLYILKCSDFNLIKCVAHS